MARQSGNGIAYFPLDVNIFNTFKVKALRKKCGPIAELALIKIYAAIYGEEGYYMVFDEDTFDIMQDELGLETPDELKGILESMVQKGLLNYAFLNENNAFPFIATSHGIQLQFQKSIKNNRKQQEVDPNIWILPESETIKNIVSNHRNNYDFISFNNNVSDERIFKEEVEARLNTEKVKPKETDGNQNKSDGELNEPYGQPNVSDGELNITEGQLSSTKFNYVKRKEKEKKIKESKVKETHTEQDIPKDLKTSSTDTSTKSGGGGRRKEKRYSEKDKPENNYGEPVSKLSEKTAYGEFENVWLTDKELKKLKTNHPNTFDEIIETLSSYKASAEKGYKSDYAAMNNWVIKRVENDRSRSRSSRKKPQQEVSPDRLESLNSYEEHIYSQFKNNLDSQSGDDSIISFMDTVNQIGKPKAII